MNFDYNQNGVSNISANSSGTIKKLALNKIEVEQKKVEESSLNALSNYGKANVVFSGSTPKKIELPIEERIKKLKERVAKDPNFGKEAISYINRLESGNPINEYNIDLAEKLCFAVDEKDGTPLFKDKTVIDRILYVTNIDLTDLTEKEKLTPDVQKALDRYFKSIGINLPEDSFYQELSFNIKEIDTLFKQDVVAWANELCFAKGEDGNDLIQDKGVVLDFLYAIPVITKEQIRSYINAKDKNGEPVFKNVKDLSDSLASIVDYTNSYDIDFDTVDKLLIGTDENGEMLFKEKHLLASVLKYIVRGFGEITYDKDYKIRRRQIAEKMCFDKNDDGTLVFPDREQVVKILDYTNDKTIDFVEKLYFTKDESGKDVVDKSLIADIVPYYQTQGDLKNTELIEKLIFGTNKDGTPYLSNKKCVPYFAEYLHDNSDKLAIMDSIVDLCNKNELEPSVIPVFFENQQINIQDYKKLLYLIGASKLKTIPEKALYVASKISDLAGVKDVNEIDLEKKKDLIRQIISQNISLYSHSDSLKDTFPLIPSNKDEYCSLVRDLVKSIGIETNELEPSQINEFNSELNSLSNTLASLNDEEFNALEFKQEYEKDDFIKNTFEIVKDLSRNERQKVYDYFGFELKHNRGGVQVDRHEHHKFSIIGYPVNLNNGKKLAKIENPHTREIVEKLRPEVIRFSENNHVTCSNKEIEPLVNEILEVCPSLRTTLGKVQHGTHAFDVFKHSLKVMQKIAQNPNFEKLEENDKKILLLASLFHDLSKAEGVRDPFHANESSFDTFYITKKFNLTKEEAIKLYTLIKHHEWLGYTNSKKIKSPEEKEQRLKSVAYDLHYDNLFELSKIFTEADLKAVNSNDNFFNKNLGVFTENSQKIDSYIKELKVSQPLLPVTKIPTASRIKEAITTVNSDGSTNLKGIYQDKNGMVIIKYNEVGNEAWEKIGFPKNSVSSGISSANTGNIKWFAHGLDYKEQLQNFDAFQLPDSDALLSVSYMELPEKKYRLFRTQGVLLDVDTKYQHGGGETDAGSGCKKDLNIFKNDYAYNGSERHSDRMFVSNLIKSALNITDEEYIEFVKQNANKSLIEIEPKEIQEKLIEAFSTINSFTRRGDRSYNEMYATNPRVMGVFAYSPGDDVGDVMQFIENQESFLKEYAIEEDLPFVVFGN